MIFLRSLGQSELLNTFWTCGRDSEFLNDFFFRSLGESEFLHFGRVGGIEFFRSLG